MDKDFQQEIVEKKPYQKPLIEKVRLVAEEAVLGGCKGADSSTGSGSVINCSPAGPCSTIGS